MYESYCVFRHCRPTKTISEQVEGHHDTWMPRTGIVMDMMQKFISVLFRNKPELWRTFRRRRTLGVRELNLSYNVPLDWCDKQIFRNNVLLFACVIIHLV